MAKKRDSWSLNKTQINHECQKQVITHLDNLFAVKNFSDLEITCDGEVFCCHRNILSARCPVMLQMLQADMIGTHDYPKESVPHPVKKERQVELFLVHLDPSKPPTQFKVTCPKNGNMGELCLALGKLAGISAESLIVTDVYSHRFHKIYSNDDQISHIMDGDDIFVYETDTTDNDLVTVAVYLMDKCRFGLSNSNAPTNHFGQPLLVSLPRFTTVASLYEALLVRMSRYVKRPEPEDKWPVKLFSLHHVNSYGNAQIEPFNNTADELSVSLKAKKFLRLDWHPKAKSRFFDEKKAQVFNQDDSWQGKAKPNQKENQTQKFEIRDVKKAVFAEVLRFIYSGKISSDDSLKNLAMDILVAANKYQLDLLKKLCEAQLQSTLNARNCFDLLVLGGLHQAANLKMAALHFVSMNSASLIETDVYEDFFHNQCSDLVFEVTNSMILDKEISSLGASSNNNN